MVKNIAGYLGQDRYGMHWFVKYHKSELANLNRIYFAAGYANSKNLPRPFVEKAQVRLGLETRERAKFEISVDEPYRRRGVGTLLLSFVERYAANEGFKELYGDISRVDSDYFKERKKFYQKNKFTWELDHTRLVSGNLIVGRVSKLLYDFLHHNGHNGR